MAIILNTITITAPVGSVLSWLKEYTNTPALPNGWVECNGQVLSDTESVYDGQTIPDLNGDNRFLRGNSTSGSTGGSATANLAHTHTGPSHAHSFSDSGTTGTESSHTHSFSDTSTSETQTAYLDSVGGGTGTIYATGTHDHDVSGTTGSAGSHNHSFTASGTTGSGGTGNTSSALSASQAILPPYYNVVWIMRIK